VERRSLPPQHAATACWCVADERRGRGEGVGAREEGYGREEEKHGERALHEHVSFLRATVGE